MEIKRFLLRKISLSDTEKEYIEKKVEKFSKFFSDSAEASVTVTADKRDAYVEINFTDKGAIFRSKGHAEKVTAAADDAVSNMERQLRKRSTKLQKFNRDKAKAKAAEHASLEAAAREAAEEDDDDGYDDSVEKIKDTQVYPMTVDDAIIQMEMLGHKFFVFQDIETGGKVSVLYQRDTGGYGLMRVHEVG
jgi:putative sigma-54 modulation protein